MSGSNHPNYKIIKKLGQGACGCAYKVLNEEDNKIYVIKKILLDTANDEEINKIKNEAKILSSLNSENIVKYISSYTDNESFNIVMEYCDGLDLHKYISEHKKSNDFIKRDIVYHIILDICNGIKDIHKNNLIHRDLKPANIFLKADMKVKIGDFGISKQLQSTKEYAKTNVGTYLYMAPEIIKAEQYNNKVDIWALGCIIHELCTLNACFQDLSDFAMMNKIIQGSHDKINKKLYGQDLQNLIDLLLNTNYKERPNIDEVLIMVYKNIGNLHKDRLVELYENDEVYLDYLIERNIVNSIDQIKEKVLFNETNVKNISSFGFQSIFYIITKTIPFIGDLIFGFYLLLTSEKRNFIKENSIIREIILNQLIQLILENFKKNLFKGKIIIYNEDFFNNKITKIKSKLLEKKNIERLQKKLMKNINIVLLGLTNTGKSTLINEFLKLDKSKKAEEGREMNGSKDFIPCAGNINNTNYILYDTNGITNTGMDSFKQKIKKIREKLENQNEPLINNIWYCFSGSFISAEEIYFLTDLLDIQKTYSIPIIYIHTKTFSKAKDRKCKKALEKILNEIYLNDKSKVDQQLNNYISILARGDDEEEAFGLDELEKLSKKSVFSNIKQNINKIIVNVSLYLVFTEYNINNLISNLKENNLDKLLEEILNVINNDKLGLTLGVEKKNKKKFIQIFDSYKLAKDIIKAELIKLLTTENLKKDYAEKVKSIYDKKNENYKKDMSYEKFCANVESYIYSSIKDQKEEIANNLLNIAFFLFIIEIIKEGIKEKLKDYEGTLEEFYAEIFNKLNND